MAEERVQRRLAAILAADVVGFSRLMGEDEEGTLATLTSHRTDLFEPTIAAFNGRVVKLMGDGILAEFASAVDAVTCAIAIQTAMSSRNAAVAEDNQILFRMGINVGDIIVEGDDIYGDGVNVAARLEGLADSGGVCISRTVRDQIRDKLDYKLDDLGEIEVKNIARPVRAFRVSSELNDDSSTNQSVQPAPSVSVPNRRRLELAIAALLLIAIGTVVWLEPWTPRVEPASIAQMRLPLPDKPSVAILPFDVTSTGTGDRALANAINEDLTRGLARVSGLFVIARSSTLNYVGANVSPARVAQDLGVRHVVRASLRRSNNRVRIDAELADALSGRIVWSHRFDHASSDIFVLQDQLVQLLASHLVENLSRTGDQHRFTENVDAYFSWFEGDKESWLNTPVSYGKARALALSALDRDPNFIRAKALLAFVQTQSAYFKLANNTKEALAGAHKAATAAITAQPDDWYTQSVYAQSLLNLRDYEGALVAFDRAIELEPANANLLTRSTLPLIFLGRGKEAERRLRIAIRLNPYHDWLPDQLLGQALFVQSRYRDAVDSLTQAHQKNPRFIGNMWWRAATFGQLGEQDKAKKAVAEIMARMPDAAISRSFIQITDDAVMERFRAGLRKAGLPEHPPLKFPKKPSIAVLPFTNMSDDKQQEYFSAGITEDITTDLSKVVGLLVTPSSATRRYKGKDIDRRVIAGELGVRHILEGGVRRVGNQLRITAKLIDAATGVQVWAERYDRKQKDVFAIQDDIADRVVAELSRRLKTTGLNRVARAYTPNLQAYDLYIQGRAKRIPPSPPNLKSALKMFEKAIEIDPRFAGGFAGAAYVHVLKYGTSPPGTIPSNDLEAALRLAEKAVRLDPTFGPAWGSLSEAYSRKGRYDDALVAIKKAMKAAPNDSLMRATYGRLLGHIGRPLEGIEQVKQAMRMSPDSLPMLYFLGANYRAAGKFDDAIKALTEHRKRLGGRIIPSPTMQLIAAYAQAGQLEKARAETRALLKVAPRFTVAVATRTHAYKSHDEMARFLGALRQAGVPK